MRLFSELAWALRQPLDLAGALLLRCLAACFTKDRNSGQYPWVIGGHRGRMHTDNAGELHDYILAQGSPAILWIANAPLAKTLAAQGIPVLVRASWRARLAIFRAPVIIYSHGEDDVDPYAIFWRKCLGLRVHLNHCMNHLKAGQFYRKDIESFGWFHRAFFRWTMVDFDLLPASSELEKHHFELSLPHHKERIVVGGGAHIDGFLRMRATVSDRSILWFPTFRDTPQEAKALDDVVTLVYSDLKLRAWLQREHRILYICRHINSAGLTTQGNSAEDSIQFCPPPTLLGHMAKAELFISDYSGLTADWLVFQRPAVFFAFDLDTYRQSRRFYIPYENFQYGPRPQTVGDLVNVLTQGTWLDMSPWAERRAQLYSSMFPSTEPNYCARTLQTIQNHLC